MTLRDKLIKLRDEMRDKYDQACIKMSKSDAWETWIEVADERLTFCNQLTALIDTEPEQDVCEWEWSSFNAAWVTKCSGIFLAIDNSLSDNGMKFCPYCGGQIKEVEG